jgi:hypothetical protein
LDSLHQLVFQSKPWSQRIDLNIQITSTFPLFNMWISFTLKKGMWTRSAIPSMSSQHVIILLWRNGQETKNQGRGYVSHTSIIIALALGTLFLYLIWNIKNIIIISHYLWSFFNFIPSCFIFRRIVYMLVHVWVISITWTCCTSICRTIWHENL